MVREKPALHWSLEPIAGRLRHDGVIVVSTAWIYRYTWSNRAAGESLCNLPRRSSKRYDRRSQRGAGRGRIPSRKDISERDPIVERKTRIGDQEVDTIIGSKHQGALVSMVDRPSTFTFLALVSSKATIGVCRAIAARLRPVKNQGLIITAGNGKECGHHRHIARALSASYYCARPNHSLERGLNEYTNGLVRQYLPRATNSRTVELAAVMRGETILRSFT